MNMEKPKTLVDFRGVEIERAAKTVLKNVDFRLAAGEFTYLVGRVGSGKSSLLKTMYADVPLTRGDRAEVMGFDLLSLRRREVPFLRRRTGIVFQDFQLLQDRSAGANLEFVLRATGWRDKASMERRMDEVLNAVGMANKGYKMPHELSGGEQQRIVIARALLNDPELILADEPTGNLDPETGINIVALLHQLAHAGKCILMATHNMQLVEDFPGNILRCEGKEVTHETL